MATNSGQPGNSNQLSYNGKPLFPDPSSLRTGTLDNRVSDLNFYGSLQGGLDYQRRHDLANSAGNLLNNGVNLGNGLSSGR